MSPCRSLVELNYNIDSRINSRVSTASNSWGFFYILSSMCSCLVPWPTLLSSNARPSTMVDIWSIPGMIESVE